LTWGFPQRAGRRVPWVSVAVHKQIVSEGSDVGSVIKKRRKRMAKKKHRKLLKKTRIQRRNKK
jgi:hypothetical protein